MSRPTSSSRLILACLIASGCSLLAPVPDRSRFFTLSVPPAARDDVETAQPTEAPGIVYGLGPVSLPAYLDRNQVATRLSPTEVAYAQWDLWAAPLGANVSSVLRQALAGRLRTDAIVTYPWVSGARVDYQIEVRLLRFEGDVGGETHLAARWFIRDVQHDRELVSRETSLTRPGRPGDTAATTAALSDMLNDLGGEIAAALRAVPPPRPAPTSVRSRMR